jgi:histidinol phosphatase-like enzyme (inositol monophosphatase family)
MSSVYARELRTAREICEAAGQVQLSSRAAMGAVVRKEDRSPVTDVDRRCEALIAERLNKAFPGDGILGEETGQSVGSSGRQWIIDPLDGTRPYIRGIPTYSVLLALEEEGKPVVGVIHLPQMGQTCWGSAGGGAFLDGEPIRVSETPTLEESTGSALGYVQRADEPIAERLLQLMRQWDYVYGFMDAYSYLAVASGKLDLCVNLLDKAWDCAAGACIVAEAGGRYSDISGNESVYNGSIILSNGLVHDALLEALAEPQ